MGNVNGREGGNRADENGSNGESTIPAAYSHRAAPVVSSDSVANVNNNANNIYSNTTPPRSPARSVSPLLFAPQAPVAPLPRSDGPPFLNQMWRNESPGFADHPPEQGIPIPTIISWNYGGNEVFLEGSWDNWMSRKLLQRSGKDHSILLVLPSGIYHYKFIVDGEWRYIPDLPFVADEMGCICNLLDVNNYVPESLDSVAEFEVPPSPDSTYGQSFPTEEDFAKEPLVVPQQLHLTVLDMENSNEASSSKPQHVVLNHLFIEKGWASQSLVALGLTHRFESKFVTVVLYKPVKR